VSYVALKADVATQIYANYFSIASNFRKLMEPNDVFAKNHGISIPTYAVEQQRTQSGVPKNEMPLMSFIFKMMLVLYQSVSISGSISNIY
jgi:hypothetical protein